VIMLAPEKGGVLGDVTHHERALLALRDNGPGLPNASETFSSDPNRLSDAPQRKGRVWGEALRKVSKHGHQARVIRRCS